MPSLFDPINSWFAGTDMAGQSDLYEPADYSQARRDLLGGLGGVFLGAGMAPREQRGAIFAQGIPQAMGGYRESLQGGLKERMLGEKLQGWKGFKEAAAAGKFGDLPPGMAEIMKFTDPESAISMIGDYYGRTPATPDFVTLVGPGGTTRSFERRDPQIESLMSKGWTERAGGGVTVNVGDKMNEGQARTAVILPRLRFGVTALEEQDGALLDPAGALLTKYGGQYFTSPAYKQAKQVGRQFLGSILRLESGATITEEELDIADSTYLPQPGDPPEVIEQKRLARRQIYEGVVESLGNRQDIAEPLPPGQGDVVDDPAAIPEGATVTDNTTGKRYKKVKGQLVPVQ